MDKIVAKGLSFMGCHGVLPEEKNTPQPFLVDLELRLDLGPAGRCDQLEYTVDYGEVFRLVKEIVETQSYNLLETLAAEIAEAILTGFPVASVRVEVKKPGAPVPSDFEYFAVIIERFKQ